MRGDFISRRMIVIGGTRHPNIILGDTLYERYGEVTEEALESVKSIVELVTKGFIQNATIDGVYLRFLERLAEEPKQKNSAAHALQSDLERYFDRLFISYDEYLSQNNYIIRLLSES